VPLSLSFGTIVVSLVARVVKVCMVSSNKPPQLWMGVISAMVAAFLHTCLSPEREARIVQKSSFDTWRDGATRARKKSCFMSILCRLHKYGLDGSNFSIIRYASAVGFFISSYQK
jgi:hypothetical protein